MIRDLIYSDDLSDEQKGYINGYAAGFENGYAAAKRVFSKGRTAHWVKQNPMVDTEECSSCGYNIPSEELESPFCPDCGAYMYMREEVVD